MRQQLNPSAPTCYTKDHGVYVPAVPDLAQSAKLGSDHFENLTNVFNGA